MKINMYTVKLVKSGVLELEGGVESKIRSPRDAAMVLKNYLDGVDREHFVVIMVNSKNRIIGVNTAHIGSLSSAIVHPREVFKPAIIANSAGIIVGHNHPSGNPTPSREDLNVTARLVEAGKILGIEVIDHIIIGDFDGSFAYVSLKEKGVIPI